MALPKAVRRLTPDWLRHSVTLRALALGAGLIPPRTMHSAAESALLAELAGKRRIAVEIGVYEGSSALVLCRSLPSEATLHLVDPFIDDRGLAAGWRGTALGARRVVARATRVRGGPEVRWHVERSEEVGSRWSEPVDLVFIDGDHAEATCRLDWEQWSPWVREGGVVVFHDARQNKPGGEGLPGDGGVPGPTAVVDSLFRGRAALEGWRLLREVDTAVAVERVAPPLLEPVDEARPRRVRRKQRVE